MVKYNNENYYTVNEFNDKLHFLYKAYNEDVDSDFTELHELIMNNFTPTNTSYHPSPVWLENLLLTAVKHEKIDYITFTKGESGIKQFRAYTIKDVYDLIVNNEHFDKENKEPANIVFHKSSS